MNLEWNVWYNEFNTNKIKPFNVFNHYSFSKVVTDIFLQMPTHCRIYC